MYRTVKIACRLANLPCSLPHSPLRIGIVLARLEALDLSSVEKDRLRPQPRADLRGASSAGFGHTINHATCDRRYPMNP